MEYLIAIKVQIVALLESYVVCHNNKKTWSTLEWCFSIVIYFDSLLIECFFLISDSFKNRSWIFNFDQDKKNWCRKLNEHNFKADNETLFVRGVNFVEKLLSTIMNFSTLSSMALPGYTAAASAFDEFDKMDLEAVNDSATATAAEKIYGSMSDLADAVNCSGCLNELCIPESDYIVYRSWVSVDTFEMVLIALNIIVFLAGIIGNSLVSHMKIYA